MRPTGIVFYLFVLTSLGLTITNKALAATATTRPDTSQANKNTYMVVPVKGVIGRDFTASTMSFYLAETLDGKPSTVVLEIYTLGGSVSEAEQIVDLMIRYKDVRFIALVHKALSAGAPIAMACREIYMTDGATIGAATSYSRDRTGKIAALPPDVAEKFQSVWRATCRKAADHGGHSSILAEAMVDPAFTLTMQGKGQHAKLGRNGSDKVIKAKGRILTLTAREAVLVQLANGLTSDLPALRKTLGKANPLGSLRPGPTNARVKAAAGLTPLHEAAFRGNLKRARSLIGKGADVNAKDAFGWTPLQWALVNRIDKVAEAKRTFDNWPQEQFPVEIGILNGMKALLAESSTPEKSMAKLLLSNGTSLISFDIFGATPLHHASSGGLTDVVREFLATGANVNIKAKGLKKRHGGDTPLHVAAGAGKTKVASLLLANGAEINAKNEWDSTPLHAAANAGQMEAASLLLAKGAVINAKDKVDETPLFVAATWGHDRVVELLLEKGADPNINSKRWGEATALHRAVIHGHPKVVELLLTGGASPNMTDQYLNTPLHRAVTGSHGDPVKAALIKTLLANGADPDARDYWGQTALFDAVIHEDTISVELLLKAGASIDIQDQDGKTPIKEAVDREHMEIASLLFKERSRRAKAAEESPKWSLEKALNEMDRETKKKKDSDAE